MFNLGGPEMLLLGILALMLFGPKKLPELGKALGQGLAAFKESSRALTEEFTRQLEDETREPRQAATIPQDVLLPPRGTPMAVPAPPEPDAEAAPAVATAEIAPGPEELSAQPESATVAAEPATLSQTSTEQPRPSVDEEPANARASLPA